MANEGIRLLPLWGYASHGFTSPVCWQQAATQIASPDYQAGIRSDWQAGVAKGVGAGIAKKMGNSSSSVPDLTQQLKPSPQSW